MNTQHEQSSPSYLAALQRQLYQRDPSCPFEIDSFYYAAVKQGGSTNTKYGLGSLDPYQSTYRFVAMTMLIITAMMLIILMNLIAIIIKLMMV